MDELRTDYKDQLLDTSVNTERKYDLVDSDGNVVQSGVFLRDITQYSQTGDTFGAADINKITAKINEQNNNLSFLLKPWEEIARTQSSSPITVDISNYTELKVCLIHSDNNCQYNSIRELKSNIQAGNCLYPTATWNKEDRSAKFQKISETTGELSFNYVTSNGGFYAALYGR